MDLASLDKLSVLARKPEATLSLSCNEKLTMDEDKQEASNQSKRKRKVKSGVGKGNKKGSKEPKSGLYGKKFVGLLSTISREARRYLLQ